MRNILLPLLFALSGCAQNATTNNIENSDEANIELATKTFDAFNAHNWELMASYYADTAWFLDPSLGEDYVTQSREQSVKKYKGLQSFAADIHDSIVSIHASDNMVTVQFVSTGTSGGQKWRLPICSILTIKDGKVVRDATYYDR